MILESEKNRPIAKKQSALSTQLSWVNPVFKKVRDFLCFSMLSKRQQRRHTGALDGVGHTALVFGTGAGSFSGSDFNLVS